MIGGTGVNQPYLTLNVHYSTSSHWTNYPDPGSISSFTYGVTHCLVLSWNGNSGQSAIWYLDGHPIYTSATGLGATSGTSGTLYLGNSVSQSNWPITLSAMVAVNGYAATAADAIALTGQSESLTSWAGSLSGGPYTYGAWTLQGTSGLAPEFTPALDGGLQDQSGNGYHLSTNVGGTTGAVYAASVLTYTPSAMIQTTSGVSPTVVAPFSDTTGWLVVIPTLQNSAVATGGPALPTSVVTTGALAPTWLLNGDSVSPVLLALDGTSQCVMYQLAERAVIHGRSHVHGRSRLGAMEWRPDQRHRRPGAGDRE